MSQWKATVVHEPLDPLRRYLQLKLDKEFSFDFGCDSDWDAETNTEFEILCRWAERMRHTWSDE